MKKRKGINRRQIDWAAADAQCAPLHKTITRAKSDLRRVGVAYTAVNKSRTNLDKPEKIVYTDVYTKKGGVRMLVTIQKWGNSQGIRIPKKILENVKFKENERVDIQELNGDIIIKKIAKEYSSLDELFEGYEGEYKCEEYDFGEDVGLEKI